MVEIEVKYRACPVILVYYLILMFSSMLHVFFSVIFAGGLEYK